MDQQLDHSSDLRSAGANFLITAGVIITVIMALLLSQLDTLQVLLPPPLPSAVAQVTRPEPVATDTPLPSTPLPTATATPLPPTSTPSPVGLPSATAVPVLARCGDVPPGWIGYTVQPGDSYFYLSAHSGATLNEIVQANCLDPNILISGIQIYLPARPPVRISCGPPTSWVRYTVLRGDTLFSLAMRHGTTVYAIMQANCLSSSYLLAERQIYLPLLAATATPLPTSTPTPLPTSTPIPLPSATPSQTPTATPSATPTSTPGGPFPPTWTPSPTPTPSDTPSATVPPSPTPTATTGPTNTPTPSPSPSPSLTPTPSTPTPSPTVSPTPPPSMTPTATPSPTISPTPSPSPAPGPGT